MERCSEVSYVCTLGKGGHLSWQLCISGVRDKHSRVQEVVSHHGRIARQHCWHKEGLRKARLDFLTALYLFSEP